MSATSSTEPAPNQAVLRAAQQLDRALEALVAARPYAKAQSQDQVLQMAEVLMGSAEGMRLLFERAPRFDENGVFSGGPWQDPRKLLPALVAGCLQGVGVYPVVEILSDLRVLAIATGRVESAGLSREGAAAFLAEAMALNLGYLFPGGTEEERISGGPHRGAAERMFSLVADLLGLESLRSNVATEIELICHQRPIATGRVRKMIRLARRIPTASPGTSEDTRLETFVEAVYSASALSRKYPDLVEYRKQLKEVDGKALGAEASELSKSMAATGLVAPHHAVLLRQIAGREPGLLPTALALGRLGKAEVLNNQSLATSLVRVAIFPGTAQAVYGLSRLLERGLLSRTEVAAGLRRLFELDLQPDVQKTLLDRRDTPDGVSANAILLAGALSVLGQPLGVGQGSNPTCQAARGISLWAQHAPAYFLELLISAARDGQVEMPFEGTVVRSQIGPGQLPVLGAGLDAASLVLVPHLNSVYEAMMQLVAIRHEDGHKWVNPGMYGRWVPRGFASVFADTAQTTVERFEDFVRRFYATHHPSYTEGHALMYPNPVGLCITNGHCDYLGPHAVSIQRVREDPSGKLRVYFFNPNNEGRQDWGAGVRPSVRGHGESEGESSLPFRDFTARLYAFHYNPYEEGDAFAVPEEEVRHVEKAARESWGRAFRWVEAPPLAAGFSAP